MREQVRILRLVPAVIAAFGCLCLTAAGASASATYGGLGALGHIAPGAEHNQVEVGSPHGFVVNPTDGSIYIADQTTTAIRIQKFNEKGEFVAEGQTPLPVSSAVVGGLAIDPEKERVYALLNAPRPSERAKPVMEKLEAEIATLEKKRETKEKQRETAEKKGEAEKVATLTAEIKKVEEEEERKRSEEVPFDSETLAAYELLAFSTKSEGANLPVATGTGIKNGVLVEQKELGAEAEDANDDLPPLLEPRGITVDPATHDVIVVGKQDVAKPPPRGATETENTRAAAQRVHTLVAEKKIGPRYLDEEDCLEGGNAAHEPACEEIQAPVSSPIVLPGSRLITVREGAQGELWELPSTTGDAEGFASTAAAARIAVQPKQVFQLTDVKELSNFGGNGAESEQGDTMAFAPTSAGHGLIELKAKLSPLGGSGASPGAIVLGYEEGGNPQIHELGWTGGANVSAGKPACIVPAGASSPVLVGGDGKERTLLFNTIRHTNEQEAEVSLRAFGPGGEACGNAEPSPLKVEVNGVPVESLKLGAEATIVGGVKGANALSTTWSFENLTTHTKEKEETTGFGGGQPTLVGHKFAEPGTYKVTAIVTPDDFQPPLAPEVAEVHVEGGSLGLSLNGLASIHVGESALFTAKATDPFTKTPSLTYTWEFGDGTSETTKGGLEASVKHVYSAPCSCTVRVKVSDGTHSEERTHLISVIAAPPPNPGGGGGGGGSTPPPQEKPKGGVLPFVEAHLATSAISVNAAGAATITASCAGGAGAEACSVTVALRTLNAVAARHHGKKKRILQLASGSFSLVPGETRKVTLHLSGAARALLARLHTVRAVATIVAHSPAGATRQTQSVVTLKLAKKKKH